MNAKTFGIAGFATGLAGLLVAGATALPQLVHRQEPLPAAPEAQAQTQLAVPQAQAFAASRQTTGVPFAGSSYSRGEDRAIERRASVIPAGARLAVRIDSTVSTATARSGDVIPAELAAPVREGGAVLPAGTPVRLRVEAVESAGRLGGRARLVLAVDRVGRAPVAASEWQRVGRSHTQRNTNYIGGGALIGALAGQAIGQHTKSTVRGAAAGALLGTGVAAATADNVEFSLPAGQVVHFTLLQPARV